MPLNAADPGKGQLRGEMAQLEKAAGAKAPQGEDGLVPAAGWVYSWGEGSILQHGPVSAQKEA